MHPPSRNRRSVLTIAGSDSGGGAGIQADLKTFAAYGLHGVSVITALTAQNTRGVQAVHVPDRGFLRAQLESVFSDFDVAAVKLGMLANEAVIFEVAEALERFQPAHVVLDPVMIATSGATLLDPTAVVALRARLFPLATLLTPNVPEAELLAGGQIEDVRAVEPTLRALLASGARAVFLKGGHMPGQRPIVDVLAWGNERVQFEHARLAVHAHGTGCTLAAAVSAGLARGASLVEACRRAGDYVHAALECAYVPGQGGLAVLDHGAPAPALVLTHAFARTQ